MRFDASVMNGFIGRGKLELSSGIGTGKAGLRSGIEITYPLLSLNSLPQSKTRCKVAVWEWNRNSCPEILSDFLPIIKK